jgi:hypothetical protein
MAPCWASQSICTAGNAGPRVLTQVGPRTRMQASKWLPGLAIGPFRYVGSRGDDPNDVVPHEDRRELRGSRLLAAWMNHWDAREQNTMDAWLASDAKHSHSSPGYVRHYIIDTSDVVGGGLETPAATLRLGYADLLSLTDIGLDFVSLGLIERPWDRAKSMPGREKFGVFSALDFDPSRWRGLYPNGRGRRARLCVQGRPRGRGIERQPAAVAAIYYTVTSVLTAVVQVAVCGPLVARLGVPRSVARSRSPSPRSGGRTRGPGCARCDRRAWRRDDHAQHDLSRRLRPSKLVLDVGAERIGDLIGAQRRIRRPKPIRAGQKVLLVDGLQHVA